MCIKRLSVYERKRERGRQRVGTRRENRRLVGQNRKAENTIKKKLVWGLGKLRKKNKVY